MIISMKEAIASDLLEGRTGNLSPTTADL